MHRGLSIISGGRIGGDYQDKLLEKTRLEEGEYNQQVKDALIFNNPVKRLNIVGMNAIDKAELISPIQQKNIIIERGQIDDVLESQYGINPDSTYGKALIQQFQSLPRNDRTVNAFETEVASSITNKFVKENTFIIKEVTKKYAGLRQTDTYKDMDSVEFNALRDKEIRDEIGIPNAEQDIKDGARFYAGLAADMEANADWNRKDPGPDAVKKKAAYLKQKEEEYFENKVAGEFGLKTKAQIRQQLYPTIAIDTATFVASGHAATETAIAGTRIDSTLLKKYQHSDVPEDIDLYNYITNDLKGNTLNSTLIWEKELTYKSRIELLKQESYVKNLVRNAQYNVDLLMTTPEG